MKSNVQPNEQRQRAMKRKNLSSISTHTINASTSHPLHYQQNNVDSGSGWMAASKDDIMLKSSMANAGSVVSISASQKENLPDAFDFISQ